VAVGLMAPGATLIREPREIFGHAPESRRWHVFELVGKFEVRLMVESDHARVFQSARAAPGTECGMPVARVEAADRRGEAMLVVARGQVGVTGCAVLVADASQRDGAVMLAVAFGTIRRLSPRSGELQLMPVMTARRMTDETGLIGRRPRRTV